MQLLNANHLHRRQDTQHNDIWHNDTQHNDTGIFATLSINDTGHVTLSISTLSITVSSAVMLSVAMLNVIKLSVVMLIVVAPHPPQYILFNLPLLGLHCKGRLCPWIRKEQT